MLKYETLYPIRNPAIPPQPADYKPTQWSRCTVEFVCDGLRFADGTVPPLETLSLGSPSRTSFGKVCPVSA